MVNPLAQAHRGLGTTLFSLLNPIPFGFFVGALIFDAIYLNSAEVMWGKAAAWLITFGLLIAILPRLINLFAVWRRNGTATRIDRIDFFLNLVAVVLAIWNAFVHSRDAYAVAVPGTILSALTVALIALGLILLSLQPPVLQGRSSWLSTSCPPSPPWHWPPPCRPAPARPSTIRPTSRARSRRCPSRPTS